MKQIRIAAAQFEARDADKHYNLSRIRCLTMRAVDKKATVVSFHECCIPGYTFLMTLSERELRALAEPVPDGPSTRQLETLAAEFGVTLLAGLLEREGDRIYNTYVAVSPDGFLARHRKMHPFVSPHLSAGDEYTVFDLDGCQAGILICYDNNLPENVRMTTLLGAEILFAPHVTCGTESVMPGRGVIPREVWQHRHADPARCRQEFLGPKGRAWLMRWLPARAYENGVYLVFTNPIGLDHDTIKPGLAMILDPYGEIVVESHELEDDVVVGQLVPEKIALSSGARYLKARRPDLYGKLAEPLAAGERSVTNPGWRLHRPPNADQ